MSSFYSMLLAQNPEAIWSWGEIVTLVVSSSVLAAILTSVFDWLLVNKTYRNDYYKIIIKKRIDAYTKFDLFIGEILKHRSIKKKIILDLFNDNNQLLIISEKRKDISLEFRWLSDKAHEQFVEIWSMIIEIEKDLKSKKYPAKIKEEKSKILIKKINSLIKQCNSDFNTIYKVKKFLKTSKK